MDHRTKKRIKEVKKKARPGLLLISICDLLFYLQVLYSHFHLICLVELNEKGAWEKLQIYKKFDEFTVVSDNCERINLSDVTPKDFIEKYEKLYKPVVICGIQENWKAKFKWTLEVKLTSN